MPGAILPYVAERVDEISGSFMVTATSILPNSVNSIPNAIFGCEKAARVIDAESSVISKIGVKEEPSQPVAELLLGSLISATTLAPLGRLACKPKSAVAVPANVALVPTSYDTVAPSLKIPVTEIPAPGIGAENSSLLS